MHTRAHAHGETPSKVSLNTVMAEGINDDLYLVVFVFGSRNLPLHLHRLLSKSTEDEEEEEEEAEEERWCSMSRVKLI